MIRLMRWLLDKGWKWMARKVMPLEDNRDEEF